ncbi:MAG: DUF4160 domain-containing protein [Bacteroidales bacterium]|nr:DUF4160 domain-containing protein [Bacteroidales bacterium]
MPTVLIVFGFVFKFYSNDHQPIHIHVLKDGHKAKFSLFPVELVENIGFKLSEIKLMESIIEENKEVIAEHWNNYFNNDKRL